IHQTAGMHCQEFHLIRASGGLFVFRKSSRSRHIPLIPRILSGTRAYFCIREGLPPNRNIEGCWIGPARFICCNQKGNSMAEASGELEGPDFEKGYETENVREGEMLLGHAFGEAVLVARRGDDLFAIGATCTHYGGPLAKGLMVDCTVHCPLHHAH